MAGSEKTWANVNNTIYSTWHIPKLGMNDVGVGVERVSSSWNIVEDVGEGTEVLSV